ncbi:hypothetical protein V1264_002433 [Littorina saxatilis]|uniref:Poly [ADP-ribose] polymerase n=1 Tax=Littorina saxatilis TaxID=31220 RepID=A0AAN9C477_9CAEN
MDCVQLLKCMSTPHQFLLLSSPPAQEKEFQELKAQYGSCFAFHGSSIENWHAIIRQGLIVASGTKFQINGAAHGKGIYLSPLSTYSFSYSRMGHHLHNLQTPVAKPSVDKNRFLSSSHLNCIALCEVIQSPELHKKTNEIWVVTKESHICTRFFFVYEDGQVGSSVVDMTHSKWCRLVEDALASCFMPVVPSRAREQAHLNRTS